MAHELPSYVVRNLVEVALKRNERNDRKGAKKPDRNSARSVAVPVVKNNLDTARLEDVKSLLKLHKRFEDEANRTLRKGIVEKRSSTKLPENSTVQSQRRDKNEDYLNDISLKLAQIPSPDLPTKFPALSSTTRQLQLGAARRLSEPLTLLQKGAICEVYPERARDTHIRPFSCPRSLFFTEDSLQREENINRRKKLRGASLGESSAQNFLDLHKHLTVFPLTLRTFAAYDSLPRFNEAGSFSGSTMVRDDIGIARESPVLWLVPARDDVRSEDAISVDYEKYLTNDVNRRDVLDDVDRRDVVSDFAESSCRALVEYKPPMYRKNVRFSEDLHEVHLYSPVQNHRTRRRRGRRRRTEEDD